MPFSIRGKILNITQIENLIWHLWGKKTCSFLTNDLIFHIIFELWIKIGHSISDFVSIHIQKQPFLHFCMLFFILLWCFWANSNACWPLDPTLIQYAIITNEWKSIQAIFFLLRLFLYVFFLLSISLFWLLLIKRHRKKTCCKCFLVVPWICLPSKLNDTNCNGTPCI